MCCKCARKDPRYSSAAAVWAHTAAVRPNTVKFRIRCNDWSWNDCDLCCRWMLCWRPDDDYARWQLTREQLLVATIEIIFRSLKTLTHDAFYMILGRGSFQILCVRKEHRWRQFYFAHKQRSVRYDEFSCQQHSSGRSCRYFWSV